MNDPFNTARELFELVCDLPPAERDAVLDERCADDGELRARVLRLLGLDDTPHPGFDRPPISDLPSVPVDSSTTTMPGKIGEYDVVRMLGAGGMGIVYEAVQPELGRRVALKLLRTMLLSDDQRRRFVQEGTVLGWLNHPGIATVYEAGTAEIEGRKHPFLAMELVDGPPLDLYVRQNELSTRERVELLARVADAVHHAHQKGVVHRDLKPGNILVDATGQPKVLDFGIARITGADLEITTRHTQAGEILGTLPYMSPEQVLGDSSRIDLRADVYALGVVLHELLTGHTPHNVRELPVPEAARVIVEDEPTRLGRHDTHLAGDLETIVAKAIDKEPERRYRSADELADDLRRFLHSEPILARPASTIYQLKKFARRNRALVAGTSTTLVALVLGLIGTLTYAFRATDRAEAAERAEGKADARAEEARLAQERSEVAAKQAMISRNLLIDMLFNALPERSQGREVTVRDALSTSLTWIHENKIDDPEVEFYLCRSLGPLYLRLGDQDRSEDLHLRAIELADEELAADPTLAAQARTVYANFLRRTGRDEDARAMWQELVDGHDLSEPGEDPTPWVSLADLGDALRRKGEFEEAVTYGELAVANLERIEKTKPSELMWAYWQLSNAHMFLHRDPARELETARHAYELFEDEGGIERVIGGFVFPLQLGNALDDNGRTEEAIEVYEDVLVRVEINFGADHEDAHLVRMNLGLALLNVERFDEAIDLTLQAYEANVEQLGPAAVSTLDNLRMVLTAFLRAEHLEEGVDWSEGVLDDLPPSWRVDSFHLLRGRMLAGLERHEEALAELLPHVEAAAARVEPGAEEAVESYRALVRCLDALGDERAARYRQLLAEHEAHAEG